MIECVRLASHLHSHLGVPLMPTLVRMIAGRIVHGRGPREFEMFRFATKPVRQWRSYLTDKERVAMQSRYAPMDERKFEEDKLQFWLRCVSNDLPCIPVTGVITAGNDRSPLPVAGSPPMISTAEALQSLFSEIGTMDGFAKPLGGGQGYGAFQFSIRDGSLVPSDRNATASQMFERCAASPYPGGGYLLQPRLIPHESLLPLMPGPGVGTIRIYTFLTSDHDLVIPFAGLRLPAKGAVCDNFSFQAVAIPIDIATGVLGKGMGRTRETPFSHFMERHPETGAVFPGSVVPCWGDVVALVTRAARVFHRLPALGWDVAVTPDGPVLVETNWEFGTSFAERLTDRGWAEDLRALYGRCTSA